MNDYRRDASNVAREARWTVFRFLPVFFLIIVVFGVTGFFTNWFGLIGGTVVERIVFEQSYQRSEAMKSKIAHEEAVLAEIQSKLLNPNLDENTRFNLKAQASAARIRLAKARGQL